MSRDEDLIDKKLLGRRNAKRLAARIEHRDQIVRAIAREQAKLVTVREQIAKLQEI